MSFFLSRVVILVMVCGCLCVGEGWLVGFWVVCLIVFVRLVLSVFLLCVMMIMWCLCVL